MDSCPRPCRSASFRAARSTRSRLKGFRRSRCGIAFAISIYTVSQLSTFTDLRCMLCLQRKYFTRRLGIMISRNRLARGVGLLYLLIAVGGGFAEAVRSSVRVPGDAAATAANIVQHATLFRVGFAADLVDFTCFLGVGLVLYVILKPVNGPIATAMLTINAVSVAIQALNMLNQLGALLV